MSLSAPKPVDDLPNLEETALGDVYRAYKEAEDARRYSAAHEQHAKNEILKRSGRLNQTLFTVDGGEVEIFPSNSYTYNSLVLTGDFHELCKRDDLGDAYDENVTRVFKVKKAWLNKLEKRGQEYIDVIEEMTDHSTGTPTIKGPSLQDMGGYAEGVGE